MNSDAPGEIASWVARHDVPRIHFSTVRNYGASKLAGEVAVRSAGGPRVYSNCGNNFMLTIARLAAEREELRMLPISLARRARRALSQLLS